MLGTDITKISRFKDKDKAFVERVLHPEEIKEYETSKDKAKYLATRWAIKEALFKADNKLFHLNKVRIVKEDRQYIYEGFTISTSSEDDIIIAVVQKER